MPLAPPAPSPSPDPAAAAGGGRARPASPCPAAVGAWGARVSPGSHRGLAGLCPCSRVVGFSFARQKSFSPGVLPEAPAVLLRRASPGPFTSLTSHFALYIYYYYYYYFLTRVTSRQTHGRLPTRALVKPPGTLKEKKIKKKIGNREIFYSFRSFSLPLYFENYTHYMGF